ncbi:flagellar basal body-associated FliL family protein [Sulfitobacter sp. F26169L]|uniref:flagellar basal body-associated FliL family protein n=1 Tax=Sulfitobacter sp. F26169L TaxID=2996015 RepID=UPI0022608E1A|nr:flagellar basal body-associated FliL family protein [Sulfitobacter sp. F26169L]MCX7565771.1 flagellar basal body-associated FliL family protein [Sulfitobacter sp. F26169L]
MAEEEDTPDGEEPKKSKMPLVLGLVLAFAGAAGGFYATWSGMILAETGDSRTESGTEEIKDPFGDIAFVEVDQMIISVNATPERRLLRFRAQLEVPKSQRDAVTKLLPRVVDVLNSYLRALEISDLEDQAALTRLRAQMLRRVQIVTGPDLVNDFLIMEFVVT